MNKVNNLNVADIALLVDLIADAAQKTDSVVCAQSYSELIDKVKAIDTRAQSLLDYRKPYKVNVNF